MPTIDDYSGAFHPDLGLAHVSRRLLAALGREYLLFGHFLNRAGLPHVHVQLGAEAREAVAIEEWMGASPVYTRRMQRAMGFSGDDVPTIFKGLQLDVGFAHQYMDVRYELESAQRGFFWLQSCGALLELEPHGEAAVVSMCHHIEDPTFDATAVATNPRARIRPIHRPPRVPSDRVPHCRWEVAIDPTAEPVREIPLTARVRASRLAGFAFSTPAASEPGGWDDYAGPFAPDFALEDLSHAALVTACREFLVQDHLLVRALLMTVADRGGAVKAAAIGASQWIGCGPVASERLRAVLGVTTDDAAAVCKVLQFHPAFLPEYTRLGFEVRSAQRARFWLHECAALAEGDPHSWYAQLGPAAHPALDAMVQAVNPRARCVPTPPPVGARLAWEVVIDASAEPAAAPPQAAMVRATIAARFAFRSRPLRH